MPDASLPARPADDFVAALMDRYDHGAAAYRELWAPILRRAAQPLLRELAGGPVARTVDVGTGVGVLLPDLETAFPGTHLLGVDRSRGMLHLAPARFDRALMDARSLALRSACADRVLLVFMLFHLEDPRIALLEARCVLREGGRVGTLTWGGELESAAMRVWAQCLEGHGGSGPDPLADARLETVDAPAKLEALLHRAGFESARAWEAELVATIDAEHLVRLRTSLGSWKPRFDSLSPEAARACLGEARRRLAELRPEDFVARGRVVHAVAEARTRS
jgi:SAM-dependent methyltransferase